MYMYLRVYMTFVNSFVTLGNRIQFKSGSCHDSKSCRWLQESNGITSKIHVILESRFHYYFYKLVHVRKYHHVIRKSLFGKQESAGNCWNQTTNQANVLVIPNHVDEN